MSLMLGKMSEKKVKNKTVNSRNAFIEGVISTVSS